MTTTAIPDAPDGVLLTVIRQSRIVVCTGSGGVGKTTTAAVIARSKGRGWG